MVDVSPNLFMDAVVAYQQTAVIKAAIELDVFSEIARGKNTAESLAQTTGAAVCRIRQPNRAVVTDKHGRMVRGYLQKQGDEYRLTPSTASFLDRSAPSWMGDVIEYLPAPEMMDLSPVS